MILTTTPLPRRMFLRGVGTTLALPFLDAMVPLMSGQAAVRSPRRFGCVYVGNGADMARWTPATEGAGFELTPVLQPLAPFRDQLVVITGLDNRPGQPQNNRGGQHSRSGVAFMSGTHAKQTEGADMQAGVTIDQYAAQKLGADTRLPSLEMAIERIDAVGACENNYTCSYLNTVSWRTPTTPLPMEFNPRFVFERLFGEGDTNEERIARVRQDRSILDTVMRQVSRLSGRLGVRDGAKLGEFLDAIRDVERRIQKVESENGDLAIPARPLGIPGSIKEHVEILFDLQLLAFQADVTRVGTFMLSRELDEQTYNEIGIPEGHHAVSHHSGNAEKKSRYGKIGTYHIQLFANFVKKLQATPDGDGSLLDHTLLLYGSGLSEGNDHNNFNVPVLVMGGQAFGVKGGRHVRYPKETPLTNLMLTLLHKLDVPLETFGQDSTGPLDL